MKRLMRSGARLVAALAFPILLGLVAMLHVNHVHMRSLPHVRQPWTPRLAPSGPLRSVGDTPRVRLKVNGGRKTPRVLATVGVVNVPVATPPPLPSPGAVQAASISSTAVPRRLTNRDRAAIRNERRKANLAMHIAGDYLPPPPAFEFRRTGQAGGLLGADQPGEPQLHLLDKVNLHLNQEQFDRDGSRGGLRPEGERGSPIVSALLSYPMLGEDGLSAAVNYSFNPADVTFVPKQQHNLSYASCAIVGNSATLLQREYGSEIDGHDMVLRMNSAPVAGYERHVGHVTTFDMVNSKHAVSLSAEVVERYRRGEPMLDGSRNRTSVVLFEASNWHRNYYTYSRLLQKLPPPQLIILSPDFANAVAVLWQQLAQRWPQLAQSCNRRVRSTELGFHKGAGCHELGVACGYSAHRGAPTTSCKPTSGFVSIVFAAQICNRVTLYGFEGVTSADADKSSHYFDDEPANLAAHSYLLTQNILQHLANNYPINIRDG
eukprot:jgi/Tetstr1/463537/TSEL_008416.t1